MFESESKFTTSSSSNKWNGTEKQEEEEEATMKLFIKKLQSWITTNPINDIIGVYEFEIFLPKKIDKTRSSVFCNVDLRSGRTGVYQGQATDTKSDCCYQIDINDLKQLLNGQLEFAQAFLTGKLKVRGNAASAFKFQRFMMDSLIKDNLINKHNSSEQKNFPIPMDALKSDIIFEMIRSRISNEPDLVKKIPFILQVNLTKILNGHRQEIATWTLDTRTPGGRIYRSPPSEGSKPDAIITVDDDDYVSILFGKLNPQKVFISGKMKIKGNIMLLQRLNQFWTQIQSTRKSDLDYPLITEILLNNQLKPGLKSEMVFFTLLQRLVHLPEPMPSECVVRLMITKQGLNQVEWTLLYDSQSRLCSVKHKLLDGEKFQDEPRTGSHLNMIMDDEDFTNLVLNQSFNLQQAIESKQIQFSGDHSIIPIIIKLFEKSNSIPTVTVVKAKF